MMQVWLINENNFFTGESKFVEKLGIGMTTIPYEIGYVKGKLVGNDWVEGATEEEISEWKDGQQIDNCSPIPTNEELNNQLVETQKLCLSLQKQILLK